MRRRLRECRALDLTDARGTLCGAILAQMGVDVVKVEKPGGDEARALAPFAGDQPGPGRSLSWLAFNVNKRSVTLDLEKESGQELFRRLVATADFVLESHSPSRSGRLGLDYERLREANPGVILVSITPFGRTGPHADYRADDLTVLGMGGYLYSTGDADRPPVRISADQAFHHAAAYAATGALMAHRFRRTHGTGQHVEVSAQEAIAAILGGVLPMWEMLGVELQRSGPFLPGTMARRALFPCKDGYIAFGVQGDRVRWEGLIQWMAEGDETREMAAELGEKMAKLDLGRVSLEQLLAIENSFASFFATKTRAEVWEQARRRRFLAYPVNSVGDNLHDPHLRAREFFVPVHCPDAEREMPYPRYLYASSGSEPGFPRPAPRAGEHNLVIYEGELGVTRDELCGLAEAGVI